MSDQQSAVSGQQEWQAVPLLRLRLPVSPFRPVLFLDFLPGALLYPSHLVPPTMLLPL